MKYMTVETYDQKISVLFIVALPKNPGANPFSLMISLPSRTERAAELDQK